MVIPINERLLSGRKLYISQNGTGGPVIFWGMYPHRGNEVEHLRESLMEIAPGQNFMLVAFKWKTGIGIFHRGKHLLCLEQKDFPDRVQRH